MVGGESGPPGEIESGVSAGLSWLPSSSGATGTRDGEREREGDRPGLGALSGGERMLQKNSGFKISLRLARTLARLLGLYLLSARYNLENIPRSAASIRTRMQYDGIFRIARRIAPLLWSRDFVGFYGLLWECNASQDGTRLRCTELVELCTAPMRLSRGCERLFLPGRQSIGRRFYRHNCYYYFSLAACNMKR